MRAGLEEDPEQGYPRFEAHCEWGTGIQYALAISDVIVIVDVLSFSTAVDIATSRGAIVYPCRPETDPGAYARRLRAECARPGRDITTRYSLSPASLLDIPAGTRLVLPSPNGATLSFATGRTPTFCGSLRNATAVAQAAAEAGRRVAVIAAGERWPGGSLRPALEDLIGAGAIIRHLPGTRSPEAEVALLAFANYQDRLLDVLSAIPSGRELLDRGFEQDVRLAAMLDCSENVPLLDSLAYGSRPGTREAA